MQSVTKRAQVPDQGGCGLDVKESLFSKKRKEVVWAEEDGRDMWPEIMAAQGSCMSG